MYRLQTELSNNVYILCCHSWYSWCIHSLVNGVYAFGFLFMLPQLFINYRLKSVAHLPWRSFMYKVSFFCIQWLHLQADSIVQVVSQCVYAICACIQLFSPKL